jgi:hypothetical protein
MVAPIKAAGGLMDNAGSRRTASALNPSNRLTSGSGSSGIYKTSCAKAVTLIGFTDAPANGLVWLVLQRPVKQPHR